MAKALLPWAKGHQKTGNNGPMDVLQIEFSKERLIVVSEEVEKQLERDVKERLGMMLEEECLRERFSRDRNARFEC